MKTDDLITAVMVWGGEKGVDNAYRQLNKVTEELGEWAHEISGRKGHTSEGMFIKGENA